MNEAAERLHKAVGGVIDRWYKVGLLRFNSHDDGSDDLLLRNEIVMALIIILAAERKATVDRIRDGVMMVRTGTGINATRVITKDRMYAILDAEAER